MVGGGRSASPCRATPGSVNMDIRLSAHANHRLKQRPDSNHTSNRLTSELLGMHLGVFLLNSTK